MKKLIQEMLTKNIIQPLASAVVIVRKKTVQPDFVSVIGSLITLPKRMHSHCHETLDTLSGAKWFSTLDLVSGYCQVEVAENERAKTAFTTHEGLFEFRVMPLGLRNAPATFQRLMSLVTVSCLPG